MRLAPAPVAVGKIQNLKSKIQNRSGGWIIRIRIHIDKEVYDWPFWPIIQLVLLYRRMQYGYAFRKIALTRGKFAIVDPDDYYRLNKYHWQLISHHSNSYARRLIKLNGKKRTIHMHREILKAPDNLLVDHINHNGLDNRKANLRLANHSQNMCNRRTQRHSSSFKGVSWNKAEKLWKASLRYENKYLYLGGFNNEIEAAKAYNEAAKKYHGQFAVLNFTDK